MIHGANLGTGVLYCRNVLTIELRDREVSRLYF